jgi:hypothetical protein
LGRKGMKIFLRTGLDSDSTDFFSRATLAADVDPDQQRITSCCAASGERVTRIAPKFVMLRQKHEARLRARCPGHDGKHSSGISNMKLVAGI